MSENLGLLESLGISKKEFVNLMLDAKTKTQNDGNGMKIDKFGYPIQKHYAGSITANSNQIGKVPLNEQSFLGDCNILNPLINAVVQPTGSSVFNLVPVTGDMPVDDGAVKTGFFVRHTLTDSGTDANEVCDNGVQAETSNDLCTMRWRLGRKTYTTKTGELEDLVQRACFDTGVFRNNFFYVGETGYSQVRGFSDMPPSLERQRDNQIIYEAGVRKQLHDIGESLQKYLIDKFWYGDPNNNTAGGGTKEFWGLDYLVRDTWGTDGAGLPGADLVCSTGTQADASVLNAFTWDGDTDLAPETEAIIGENFSIYRMLREWEMNYFARAEGQGLVPYSTILVMPQIIWDGIARAWPLEEIMYADLPNQFTNTTANLNVGNIQDAIVQRIRELNLDGALEINGRKYPIFIDDNIVIQQPLLEPLTYVSTMYALPLTVRGIPAMQIAHFDYSKIGTPFTEISPLSFNQTFAQWTDGGRFGLNVNVKNSCFEVNVKTQPTLMLHFPHMTARFDNLKVKQTYIPFTAYADGLAPNYTTP